MHAGHSPQFPQSSSGNSSGRLKKLRDDQDQVDFAGLLAQDKRILQQFIKKIEIEPDQDPFSLIDANIHPDLLPFLPDELELFSELFNQQFELAQELFDHLSEEEREVIQDEFTYPFRSTEQIFSENISKVFSPNTSNIIKFIISKNVLFDLFSIEDMIKSCLNTKQEMLFKVNNSKGTKIARIERDARKQKEQNGNKGKPELPELDCGNCGECPECKKRELNYSAWLANQKIKDLLRTG